MLPLRRYCGCRNGKNIGNQLNIPTLKRATGDQRQYSWRYALWSQHGIWWRMCFIVFWSSHHHQGFLTMGYYGILWVYKFLMDRWPSPTEAIGPSFDNGTYGYIWRYGRYGRYGRYVTWCQGDRESLRVDGYALRSIKHLSEAKRSKAAESGEDKFGRFKTFQDSEKRAVDVERHPRLQTQSKYPAKPWTRESTLASCDGCAHSLRILYQFVSYWFILYLLADLCQVEFLLKIAQWCPVMPSVSQDQEILLAWAWGYSLPPSCFNLKVQVSASVIARTITLWMVKFEAVLQFR